MSAVEQLDRPIERRDLESKLRELRGEVDTAADEAKSYLVAAGVVAVVTVAAAAFWLGRRRGKKKTTVVEIKRV